MKAPCRYPDCVTDTESEYEPCVAWLTGDCSGPRNDKYTTLTGDDPDLAVFIDWSDPKAGVWFRYGENDEQSTPFQTADFDIGAPDEVVRRVDAYADGMAK